MAARMAMMAPVLTTKYAGARRPGQRRPSRSPSGAAGPCKTTNTSAAAPVDVTTRPDVERGPQNGAALDDVSHDRHDREDQHGEGRRDQQDQEDEEPLVDVEHVGLVVRRRA